MKYFLLFACSMASSLLSNAQVFPYCKAGLFSEQTYYNDVSINHDLDVIYGTNLDYQGNLVNLKLDIHYPNLVIDPLPKRPVIVMLHGGSFVNGSKNDMTAYCVKLARAGYVAVSVDYRLGWDMTGVGGMCNGNIPQLKYAIYRAIQDVNASIRYMVEKAADYRVDTSYIFLAGQSEGGMTAINCGFMNQAEADILLAGASADLGKIDSASNSYFNKFNLKGIFNWCGAALDTNMIQSDTPIPLLSIHGLLDSIMPVEYGTYFNCQNINNAYPFLFGSKLVYQRMKNLGVCSEANFDALGAHCFFPSLEENVYIPAKFTCFFKNLMCGNCTTESKVSYNQKSCVESAPVEVSEVMNDSVVEIYPNPMTKNVYISFKVFFDQKVSIELLDITGIKLVDFLDENITAGSFRKNFELPIGIPKGIYLIKLADKTIVVHRKIIVN